ncbi:MAG: adenine phosphoribosyltransferase [Deltaproteobacteria bacterium]|nr:adenine phosphoribosyltransferase [Deltaproteobacteria bacterium]
MGKYTHIGGTLGALVQQLVRDVPDFPKPGILFKDITTVLEDGAAFRRIIDTFTERYRGLRIDAVVGMESRGFIFGAPLAHQLGTGLVLARKQGKLPHRTDEVTYDLEYGTATIAMHVGAIRPGQRVVVIDDLLATGGTAAATCQLVERQGGTVVECAFVIELVFLQGRSRLNGYDVCTLARYE